MTTLPDHPSPLTPPRPQPILVLTEPEIRGLVRMDLDALSAIETAFARLAEGRADVPPIVGLFVPERRGEVDVKGAHIHGLPAMAIKVASGFFDNARWGLPNSAGLMLVVSAETGFPEAVLLDNGYLTEVRTALAGAAAAKYLAAPEARTVGIIGAGTQGRYQLRALRLVRSIERVLIHDHSLASAEAYGREFAHEWPGVRFEVADVERLVRSSDIVVTCTPSHEPFVREEWLHPGLHITAMGADTADKRELGRGVLARADRLVCDLKRQCFERGEFRHALFERSVTEETRVFELGELTCGTSPGRVRDDDITVCTLTGVGVQDTAIALLTLERARRAGVGVSFPGPAGA